MSNREEWNEFLAPLHSNAIKTYRETQEFEYIEKLKDEIALFFRDNLTADQKSLVEECVSELYLISDRQSEVVYQRGLKDCVWLLKSLGVLA